MLAMSTSSPSVAGSHHLQQALSELRASSPARALVLAAEWIETLLGRTDISEAERLATLFAIDEAIQPQARVQIEQYLVALRSGSATHRSIWSATHSFWRLLFDAYGECLNATLPLPDHDRATPLFAELAIRCTRAGCLLAKWEVFHYGPLDSSLWSRVNLAYRLAFKAGQALLPVRLRPERRNETTVEREYLRAIALFSAGPDQLDAERMEIAARLVLYVLPRLQLTSAPTMGSLLWVDVAQSAPPVRLINTPPLADGGMVRFFNATDAVAPLQQLHDLVLAGEMPAALGDNGDDNARVRVSSVLMHLSKVWSGDAPMRRHRRHIMPGQMMVISGLLRFMGRLSGDDGGEVVVPRTWELRDASRLGVGAVAPLSGGRDDIRVGMLVGMHSLDGDRWRVGAVRRLWRRSDDSGMVGVELLGGTPAVASADDGASPARVMVLDPLQRGAPVRVAVPLPGPRSGVPLYLIDQGKTLKLMPLTVVEYGIDYEVRTYLCAP